MIIMTQYETTWNAARAQAEQHGLRIVEHGWEQHVIIDEPNGLIYRYPRHKAAADKLHDEINVLHELNAHKWSTAIPHLHDYNGSFATYGYIPGEVLTPERVSRLTPDQAHHIGHGIGRFLAQFHALDPRIVTEKQTSHSTTLLEYYDHRINTNPASPYYLDAKQSLSELIEHTSSNTDVVLHGDLHGLNVVVDAETNQLHGVIDISEIETGNPHQEFRKIFMTFEPSLDAAIAAYQQCGGQTIDRNQVVRWAHVNEWANLCYFSNQTHNGTYIRAYEHLKRWEQI